MTEETPETTTTTPTTAASDDAPAAETSKKDNIVKQAAIHRASMVAKATTEAEKSTTPSAFAQNARIVIELEMMALQAQLVVLDDLVGMTDDEKMECLFQVLDKNRDGGISVTELADGLRRIRGDVGFEESIAMALERVAYFDESGDAKLQLSEFKEYAMKLSEAFGSSFHEVAEMLILSIVFSDSGNDELEEVFAAIADEEITLALKEEKVLTKIMNDDRMICLFNMFDLDSDGVVDFPEVVMGLYKITEEKSLDAAGQSAVLAMLMFDEDANAVFDYAEFTRFILQLIDATGQTFNEAILKLTQAAAEDLGMTKEEVMEKLQASQQKQLEQVA